MRLLFRIFFTCVLSLFAIQVTSAQNSLKDSPIMPGMSDKYFGVLKLDIGLGPNIQSGDLLVRCDDCLFDNGMGTGFTAALSLEHYFINEFSVGLGFGYELMSFESQYREIQNRTFTPGAAQQTVRLPLEIQQRATFDLSIFTVRPVVRFRPWEGISLYGGAMLGFGTPTLTHTEEVISKIHSIGGQLYLVDVLEENEALEQNEVPEGVTGTNFMGIIGLTGHLWLRYDLNLTGTIEWRQPFGNYEFNESDFSVYAPRFMIGLEYMIYRETGK